MYVKVTKIEVYFMCRDYLKDCNVCKSITNMFDNVIKIKKIPHIPKEVAESFRNNSKELLEYLRVSIKK